MTITLAFDVYGTLIDTDGVVARLRQILGEGAMEFSRRWRERQLEYSFRRGLMRAYQDFSVCTRQALDHTCLATGVSLTEEDRRGLIEAYRALPAFADAAPALSGLRAAGRRLFAFSNGSAEAVRALLEAAGLLDLFLDVVSVDEIRSFKPDPGVYHHLLRRSGATGASTWLVSGNPFDVIGAISAGLRAAWVRRSPSAVFDPWDIPPTLTVGGLLELRERLEELQAGARAEPGAPASGGGPPS